MIRRVSGLVAVIAACGGTVNELGDPLDASTDVGSDTTVVRDASTRDVGSPGADAGDAASPIDAADPSDAADAAGPFTPASLGSRLVLWLDGDKDYGLTDGGGALWKDQSGTGNHAAQSVTAEQPVLIDAGHGMIHFAGAQDLQVPDDPTLQWGTSDFALYTVFSDTNSSYAVVYTKENGAFTGICFYGWRAQPSGGLSARLGPVESNELYSEGGVNDGKLRLVGTRKTGNDFELRIDGVKVGDIPDASSYDTTNFNCAGTPVYIGGWKPYNQMLRGDIAEVIGVKGTLTDMEMGQLESYLKSKYGL